METKNSEALSRAISSVCNELGLDAHESRLYAAVIKLGRTSISKAAAEANLHRSSSYGIVKALIKKGLISQTKNSRGLFIQPVSPQRVLDNRQESFNDFVKHIGELRHFFSMVQREPDVQLYEGKEGLKAVLNSVLDEAKNVCIFGDGDAFRKIIPGWTEQYSRRRSEQKIRVRLLLKATPQTIGNLKYLRSPIEDPKKAYSQIRLLPEALGISNGFDIYGDKIILYSFEERPVAVVIESKAISGMMQSVFNMLWEMSAVYQQNYLR